MHDFNWIAWFYDGITHRNVHVYTASFVALLLLILALLYKKSLGSADQEIVPSEKISLKNIFQATVENILNLMQGIIGPEAKEYFPLIGALFIYIFINNLLGVIPGFLPPTDNVNTNLACSLTVFLYYNYKGIRKQGFKNYIKHMMGPIPLLAVIILPIELISHIVRPISLSIRLFGNITGDHVVLGIFSGLIPLIIPIIFMLLGIFVAFIQAFVFSLLSTVYIGLAVAHEEHH